MFFLLPRRFRRCSFRFPMMCPCGKNLESLSFSLFLWGSRSGFKVRKVTVASTTILTFLDLLNVEDRVAYLDSFATGACWQKAHHLTATCPDHVISRAYLNVFHMWEMWRMWNNLWKPWFKSWSRTFDSHHTSSKFRKNKKYISEIRKKAGRFERRWGWLVDRENRRISSLFSVKRCKESCSHIAIWHSLLPILIQHSYNFREKDHEFNWIRQENGKKQLTFYEVIMF